MPARLPRNSRASKTRGRCSRRRPRPVNKNGPLRLVGGCERKERVMRAFIKPATAVVVAVLVVAAVRFVPGWLGMNGALVAVAAFSVTACFWLEKRHG